MHFLRMSCYKDILLILEIIHILQLTIIRFKSFKQYAYVFQKNFLIPLYEQL